MNELAANTIGWIGVVLILSAFALASFGVLGSDSLPLLITNLLGALSIAYISFTKKVYQSVVINAVWAVIALVGVVAALF